MFDLTSSKLLILAVVALIVVGPKDLPALLRTIGRYIGMIRRQANDFRSQFEDAMRESEIADLHKEVEQLGRDANESLAEASRSVETEVSALNSHVDETLHAPSAEAHASTTTEPTESQAALPELSVPQGVAFDAHETGYVPAELRPPTPPVAAEPHPVAAPEPATSRSGA